MTPSRRLSHTKTKSQKEKLLTQVRQLVSDGFGAMARTRSRSSGFKYSDLLHSMVRSVLWEDE